MTSGLRLLLLKNKTQPSDAYYETFTAEGHTAEFVPLLEHSPVDVLKTAQYLESAEFLEHTHRFIITSQRAVEVFHDCLKLISERSPNAAATIRAKTGYTVGPATEQVLQENGFVDVRGGAHAGNGLKLADIILAEQELKNIGKERKIGGESSSQVGEGLNDVKGNSASVSIDASPIIFFTGVIRKDIIPVKLRANGVSIKEVVIYKTEPRGGIIDNFLRCCADPVDWVVFFSPQGTEDIVEHIVQKAPRVFVASIGPTTEEYLLQKGIKPHVIADKPTATSLHEGINEFRKSYLVENGKE